MVLLVKQILKYEFVFPLELPHIDVDASAYAEAVFELIKPYVNLWLETYGHVPFLI